MFLLVLFVYTHAHASFSLFNRLRVSCIHRGPNFLSISVCISKNWGVLFCNPHTWVNFGGFNLWYSAFICLPYSSSARGSGHVSCGFSPTNPDPAEGQALHLVVTSLCCCCVASVVSDCATPQTVAHQDPRSLGFSRQEHWSRWCIQQEFVNFSCKGQTINTLGFANHPVSTATT